MRGVSIMLGGWAIGVAFALLVGSINHSVPVETAIAMGAEGLVLAILSLVAALLRGESR